MLPLTIGPLGFVVEYFGCCFSFLWTYLAIHLCMSSRYVPYGLVYNQVWEDCNKFNINKSNLLKEKRKHVKRVWFKT